ncbi:MAG: N-acetylmuramoyl-L-alanine amidase [Limisphaerales bacterium]|jgi:N-acetylmuramoyl-L-alanine amidase
MIPVVHRLYPFFLTLAVGAILQGCQSSKWESGRMATLPDQPDAPTTPANQSTPSTPPAVSVMRMKTVETTAAPASWQPTTDSPSPTAGLVDAIADSIPNHWVPLDHWASSQGFGNVRSVAKDQFHLVTRWGVFGLAARSRYANFNGSRIYLGYPVHVTNGVPYVHVLDAEKNFRPLIGWTQKIPRRRGVICIDPGHGGENGGTKSILGNFHEKAYALDWAIRLKPELEKRGWTVVLTRAHDKAMSLTERVDFADNYDTDLFLSLHFNAGGKGASGLETYCSTPRGMPSTLTRNYADPMRVILPNNEHDYRNLHLAARIHHSLLRKVGMADRGIRRARFMSVLVNQKRPAVLIEGGFISDRKEARQIATPAYRQRLAEAVAAAFD